jgi:hypothetical protein
MCCHVLAGSRERLSWRLKGRSPRQTPRQSSSRSQGLVRWPVHPVSPIQELLPWDLAASLQTEHRLLRDTQQARTQNKRTPDDTL